jgi:hypothetical protein
MRPNSNKKRPTEADNKKVLAGGRPAEAAPESFYSGARKGRPISFKRRIDTIEMSVDFYRLQLKAINRQIRRLRANRDEIRGRLAQLNRDCDRIIQENGGKP